jgi:hypothetical protein
MRSPSSSCPRSTSSAGTSNTTRAATDDDLLVAHRFRQWGTLLMVAGAVWILRCRRRDITSGALG